jgi:hypothetical protein
MSSKLPNLPLAGMVVGSTGQYSFDQVVTGSAPIQTAKFGPPHLSIQNESPDGLSLVFLPSGVSVGIPAGFWGILELRPDDNAFIWTIDYQLQNAVVETVLLTYYGPGENVASINVLGNSPINGGVAVTNSDRIVDPSDNIGLRVTDNPGSNQIVLEPTAVNRGYIIYALDSLGGTHQILNAVPGLTGGAITLGAPADDNEMHFTGPIKEVGGLVTDGILGVPIDILTATLTGITSTALQTLLSYTPPQNGWFRANLTCFVQNGGAPTVSAFLNYTSQLSGNARSHPFQVMSATAAVVLNAVGGNNTVFAGLPMYFHAQAGGAITITYRDSTNTPNDSVTATLEQLA